ncbi:MAG TPA: hypothetical protein VFH18_04030 [Erysipelotrichaceae bacterium]|jgi:hypothetical protein|nr:hypothetical protein [Erysipelotrichaceae bacterium]
MNLKFNKNKIKKKTLAQNIGHSYNDVRMSVQVKMTEGKEVKHV